MPVQTSSAKRLKPAFVAFLLSGVIALVAIPGGLYLLSEARSVAAEREYAALIDGCLRSNVLRIVLIKDFRAQQRQTATTSRALFPGIPPATFQRLLDRSIARLDRSIARLAPDRERPGDPPVACAAAYPRP